MIPSREEVQRLRQLAAELRAIIPDVATASGKAELLAEAERLEQIAAEAEKALKGESD